jgi:hypothetical protein
VDERSKVALATLLGAVAGGLWGYLYLTTGGRRVRAQLEPSIDDFVTEVRRAKRTVDKARAAADESWHTLNELTSTESRWKGTKDRVVR